ncbi:unnamed protein product [Lymnaea stagnalis]|uniref:Major facilitator superfamily (MFS) profile domain-containing protein n=1 Tax=Lymnaea stagnalis TaxID=6523 RepID=A0AAV2IIA3_LYMST
MVDHNPDDATKADSPMLKDDHKDDQHVICSGSNVPDTQNVQGPRGVPIDRGWAWVVVVGCFGMHVLVVGGVKSFGVLFVEFQDMYGVKAGDLGIIQGMAQTLMMALGLFANLLAVKFNARKVVFAGGLLTSLGFILSAYLPSFWPLYITYGLITGFGFGLSYSPCVVMVGHHFNKRRSLANGLSVAGSGVGSFILPNLMRLMLEKYNLSGCLLILGGIMLNVCVFAMLLRPLSSYSPSKKFRKSPQHRIVKIDKQTYIRCGEGEANPDTSFQMGINQLITGNDRSDSCENISSNNVSNKEQSHLTERSDKINGKNRLNMEFNVSENGIKRLNDIEAEQTCLIRESDNAGISDNVKSCMSDQNQITSLDFSTEICNLNLQEMEIVEIEELGQLSSKPSRDVSHSDLFMASLQNIPSEDLQDISPDFLSFSRDATIGSKKPVKKQKLFNWSLFKNPVFLIYAISCGLANFGYPNVFFMLPAFAESNGQDRSNSALLVSIIGITDLMGRLFLGWFSDLNLFPKRYGFITCIGISACLNLVAPVMTSFAAMAAYAALYGFFGGSYWALIAVLLAEALGVEKLSSSFGLITVFMSVSLLPGPAICGGIRDATSSWNYALIFCGTMALVGSLVPFLIPCAQRYNKAKEKRNTNLKIG